MNIGVTYDSLIATSDGVAHVSYFARQDLTGVHVLGRGYSPNLEINDAGEHDVYRVQLASGSSVVVGSDTVLMHDPNIGPFPTCTEKGVVVYRFIGGKMLGFQYHFERGSREWLFMQRFSTLDTKGVIVLNAKHGYRSLADASATLGMLNYLGYDTTARMDNRDVVILYERAETGVVEDVIQSIDTLDVAEYVSTAELATIKSSADDFTVVNGILVRAN